MHKFSVVIPLYNKGAYIDLTLRSVEAQTIHDFEIIVIDDGSIDNGAEIVNSFGDPRVRLIQQENAGVSAARNRGISEAKSNYIAFLDADDEWAPDFLETMFSLIRKYPLAGAFAAAFKVIDSKNIHKKSCQYSASSSKDCLIRNYFRAAALNLDKPLFCSSSICVPKHIFSLVGGFPINRFMGEDLDMWFRIALKYPIAYSSKVGAFYHNDDYNRTCARNQFFMDEEPVSISARHALSIGDVPAEFIKDVEEYIARKQIQRAARFVLSGNPKYAREILDQCITSIFYLDRYKWILLSFLPSSSLTILRNVRIYFKTEE